MDANAVNNILIRFAQEGIQTPERYRGYQGRYPGFYAGSSKRVYG